MTGILKLMSILVLASLIYTAPGEAAEKVLFDTGHGERFQVSDTGPLQLSGLAGIMKSAGAQVETTDQPFSDATLAGAHAVVISGAFNALHPAEIEALLRFMQQGGKLAVMLHIAPPMATLLERLQVTYTNGVIQERQNVIDNDPLRFRVEQIAPHPALSGVTRFSVHGAWGLLNLTHTARIVASTSPQAWVDVNRDQVQAKEETASFGIAVAGDVGKGGFIAFGDDALFQNKFLDDDNRYLARSLAGWLNN
ncbi:hypothetical protein Gbem_3291 [Citrifermentans bemidjiense Bem]|uniref:DUF4350 domain-containing protein n=2 Tax=Citrifermentans bemidjiense TaxID=225194 RepID=B5EAE9_CITBB|nr:hypothetical protein Gbem_3291 [Citrifermentans bemidjiense Bem]